MERNTQLRDAVFRSGRFQYEVAREAELTETRLSRLVQGRAEPTAKEKRSLARVLRVQENKLFGDEEAA